MAKKKSHKDESRKIKKDDQNKTENGNNGTNDLCVKSTAVVKFSAMHSPAAFALLQQNTDLNLPPPNWFTSSAESHGLQSLLSNSSGFPSFRMAQMFPDFGEIDVISDAENIKKLLKIPYSPGPISMVVHRIKATLLIDDFDIHKYLFRQTADNNWSSIGRFFVESVFKSVEDTKKCMTHESRRRDALQRENLLSKFLHHSLGNASQSPPKKASVPKERINTPLSYVEKESTPLPDPNLEEELHYLNAEHMFARNVMWTFEDIRMLLGTDMPIFGGKSHPCVSLRLREASKPITVLTGIDYWLDNLMSNVPEVAMCYHIDGFVQKYELIRTEDLPSMEGSKFSPRVIRDVAQNILAFLKSKATKAGHTYWLLRDKDSSLVKLYDLTSFYSDVVDNTQNPFTSPVGLLLYRVARNLMNSQSSQSSSDNVTVQTLLKHCSDLLSEERYPQIITSVDYMHCDLLVPFGTDPSNPTFINETEKGKTCAKKSNKSNSNSNGNSKRNSNSNSKRNSNSNSNSNSRDSKRMRVKTLYVTKSKPVQIEQDEDSDSSDDDVEIVTGVDERCKEALRYILHGLKCLKNFDQLESNEDVMEEVDVKATKLADTLPMTYKNDDGQGQRQSQSQGQHNTKVKNNKGRKGNKKGKMADEEQMNKCSMNIGMLLRKSQMEGISKWKNIPGPNNYKVWKGHLRSLLLEKMALVYMTLVEHEIRKERYGNALKYLKLIVQVRCYIPYFNEENSLLGLLLSRAGDCCDKLSDDDHLPTQNSHYHNLQTLHTRLMNEVKNGQTFTHEKLVQIFPFEIRNCKQMLVYTKSFYRWGYDVTCNDIQLNHLLYAYAFMCNKLSIYYLQILCEQGKKAPIRNIKRAGEYVKKRTMDWRRKLFCKSYNGLLNALSAFKFVNDGSNVCLVFGNISRLFRSAAGYMTLTRENSTTGFMLYKWALRYGENSILLTTENTIEEMFEILEYEYSKGCYTYACKILNYWQPRDADRVAQYIRNSTCYTNENCLDGVHLNKMRKSDSYYRLAHLYHYIYSYENCNIEDKVDKVEDSEEENERRIVFRSCCAMYLKSFTLYLDELLPLMSIQCSVGLLMLHYQQSFFKHFSVHKLKGSEDVLNSMNKLHALLTIIFQCELPLKMIIQRNDYQAPHSRMTKKNYIREFSVGWRVKKYDLDTLLGVIYEIFEQVLKSLVVLTALDIAPEWTSFWSPTYKEMYRSYLNMLSGKQQTHTNQLVLLNIIQTYKTYFTL